MSWLQQRRLAAAPATAYYVPEFLTVEEEKLLLARVAASPRPRWTQLAGRRLQNWGGLPTAKASEKYR